MSARPLRSRAVPGPGAVSRGEPDQPLGTIGAVLVALFGGYVVGGLLASTAFTGLNTGPNIVLGFIGLWTGFVGVPIFLSRTRGTGRLSRDFGLRLGGPADIGLGLAVALVTYGLTEAYGAFIRAAGDHADLGHEAKTLSGHGLGAAFIAFGIVAAIGAPIAEELYFRGLMQPVLQRYLGGYGGLALTAVVFGFTHLGTNPIEAVLPLAVFGAVLGALAWRTGRLGPGIVAHVTFNGITVVVLAFSR
jgi:uncharacterized protein